MDPTLLVLFGATGDLARRKLLPALHRAAGDADLRVLGVGRSDFTDATFRQHVAEALHAAGVAPREAARWTERHVAYQRVERVADVEPVFRRAASLEAERDAPGPRVYYLALPPSTYPGLVEALGRAPRPPGPVRLVLEKPFGSDLPSARTLNALLHQHFREEEVYRIDHYLGKDTVQNLLVFRFANPIFESLWHRHHVERVEITVAEEAGVDGRGAYYDETGALRDMVQNHLTQLLTLTAMEVPARLDAEHLRMEKLKVLRSIPPLEPGHAVLGQYAGYRDTEGVAADSRTETFAALALEVRTWRWHGVPFLLRTGKRLATRRTEIAVHFRCPPVELFGGARACAISRNVLRIRLQPDEGFSLGFEVKAPTDDGALRLTQQHLHFAYAEAFGRLPDAYETLLRDLLRGDPTLFVHADEVEAAWALYQPLLDTAPDPLPYDPGSWGPPAASAWFVGEPSST